MEVEMGCLRQVLYHRRDLAWRRIIDVKGLTGYIGAIEIFPGRALVDNDGVGRVKRRPKIALNGGDGEHAEKTGVHESGLVVLDIVVTFFHQDAALRNDPRHLFDLRVVFCQSRPQRPGTRGGIEKGIVEKDIGVQAVDPAGVEVVFVVAGLVHYIQRDQQTNGKSRRQPEDIDGGERLILPKAANGSPEIVL